MDAGHATDPRSYDCSEVSMTTPMTRPVTSSDAAELMDHVEELVQRHRAELTRCFEEWLQGLHPADQQPHGAGDGCARAWIERPEGCGGDQQKGSGFADSNQPSDFAPCGVVCTSSAPVAGATWSWKANVRTPPRDQAASEMAAEKKKKKKPKHRRSHEIVHTDSLRDDRTWLQKFTTSRRYEVASGILILLNAVFIGVQTQYMAVRAETDLTSGRAVQMVTPSAFLVLQAVFCVLFTLELGLRWVCDGLIDFFRDNDVWWNLLDVAVVLFGIADLLINFVVESSEPSHVLGNLTVLRVIRVVRVVRVARVIRVMRFFRELRMMIFSILGSMKSLVWVILVLAMTFYLFGITFTAATTSHLSTATQASSAENEPLRMFFGTLDRSVLSLFMAMSGGNDWGMYYDALSQLPMHYSALFLLFISFAIFAVVNIVTGVFVENAMQSNLHDREVIVHEELETKKAYLKSMREVFDEMDEDDTGFISMEEFESKLNDERVIAYFNAMKLDVSDARTVFRLLDHDMSNEVNIDEFLTGCYRLQGESRSLDMKIMQCEVRFLETAFCNFAATLNEIQEAVLARQHAPPAHAHARVSRGTA